MKSGKPGEQLANPADDVIVRDHSLLGEDTPRNHTVSGCFDLCPSSRAPSPSVEVDHVNIFAPMALADVPVHVTPLLHPDGAVRTLNLRLPAALELRVPLQVPRVYVAFGAARARVPVDALESVPTTPRDERLLVVVGALGLHYHQRVLALQTGLQLDILYV